MFFDTKNAKLSGMIKKFKFSETDQLLEPFYEKKEEILFKNEIAKVFNHEWIISTNSKDEIYLFYETYRILISKNENIQIEIRKKIDNIWEIIAMMVDCNIEKGNEEKEVILLEKVKESSIFKLFKKLNIPVEYVDKFDEENIDSDDLEYLTESEMNLFIDKIYYRIKLRKYLKSIE
jgi:hypothetical protein